MQVRSRCRLPDPRRPVELELSGPVGRPWARGLGRDVGQPEGEPVEKVGLAITGRYREAFGRREGPEVPASWASARGCRLHGEARCPRSPGRECTRARPATAAMIFALGHILASRPDRPPASLVPVTQASPALCRDRHSLVRHAELHVRRSDLDQIGSFWPQTKQRPAFIAPSPDGRCRRTPSRRHGGQGRARNPNRSRSASLRAPRPSRAGGPARRRKGWP